VIFIWYLQSVSSTCPAITVVPSLIAWVGVSRSRCLIFAFCVGFEALIREAAHIFHQQKSG